MSTHRQPASACTTHRLYGLTCDDYDRLIERADNSCETCGIRAEDTPHGVLHIDHDATVSLYAVRGLLCSRCNTNLERGHVIPADVRAAYLARPLLVHSRSTVMTRRKKLRCPRQRLFPLGAVPWQKFGDSAEAAGTARADVLREIIDWTNADPDLWAVVRQIAEQRGETMRGVVLGELRRYASRHKDLLGTEEPGTGTQR